MSRFAVALLWLFFASSAHPAAIAPMVPCDRPVLVFGEATILARGVRVPAANSFVSRLRVFFRRVCDEEPSLEVVAHERARLIDDEAAIRDSLKRRPRALLFVHYPYSDIESGVSVDALLDAYRRIAEACRSSGALCIFGGQQPVDGFSQQAEASQLELEKRASAILGTKYLPLYAYFRSEAASKRLMVPLDSGDGRLVNDEGQGLLFEVYRRCLIEEARQPVVRNTANPS